MARKVPHHRKQEFEDVALPHIDALFNLALKLTRNPKDAEDLVQETFLRAYRFFDSYKPGTHIKAWLFRILRNTFINRYRAAKARPEEVDFSKIEAVYDKLVQDDFLHANQPQTPERVVLDGVVDAEIQEAIDALAEEYRTVLILAVVEEMAYKEIAAVLKIPIGTVMSRLHRGRKQLQLALTDYARQRGIIGAEPVVSST